MPNAEYDWKPELVLLSSHERDLPVACDLYTEKRNDHKGRNETSSRRTHMLGLLSLVVNNFSLRKIVILMRNRLGVRCHLDTCGREQLPNRMATHHKQGPEEVLNQNEPAPVKRQEVSLSSQMLSLPLRTISS